MNQKLTTNYFKMYYKLTINEVQVHYEWTMIGL
jgi:hypothetical protein